MEIGQQVYMPSQRVLSRDEILEPGPAAYHMLHSMNFNCPYLFPPSLLQSVANNRIAKEDDDTPDAEVDLILGSRCLQCPTTTNHIRASPHAHRADSTAGTGDVYIWDLSPHHKSLESLAPPSPRVLTNPWQRLGCTDLLTATLLIGLPIPEMPWGGWLLGIIRVSHSCLRGEEAVLGLQGIVAVSGNFKDPKISPFA